MMKKLFLGVTAAMVLTAGCGKEEPKPKGGIQINAPGVNVNMGEDGVNVKAPGANVNVGKDGVDVKAPGANVQVK